MAALGRCEVCDVCDLGGFVNSLCGWTASIEGGRRKQREPMQRRFPCFVRRVTAGQVRRVERREHILRLASIGQSVGSPEDAV